MVLAAVAQVAVRYSLVRANDGISVQAHAL